MKKFDLAVNLPTSPAVGYPIFIRTNVLQQITAWLSKTTAVGCIVVITDRAVKKLYADTLVAKLKQQGYRVVLLTIPGGEKSKDYLTQHRLQARMLQQRCGRDTLCIALGGGVVGDLTGYVAATYMRGIPFIQIPTTLLAMVDSSVGGKTGINTAYGKNLIGAFWQPQAVVADIGCLKTLSQQHLINGLVEALKMFLTNDAASFAYAQKNLPKIIAGDEKTLQKIVCNAIKIKARVVELDEKETNLRMVLNFGHTIGHAIEQVSKYKILHGFAVALGILVEAKLAQQLGLLTAKEFAVIEQAWSHLGIHGSQLKKFAVKDLLAATRLDKKAKSGKVRYVLLKQIGRVYDAEGKFAHPVADEVVKQAILAVTSAGEFA